MTPWSTASSASSLTTASPWPIWLPILVIGAAVIGLLSSLILSKSHSCRGGGIPTSVAAIRGVFNFKWISGIILLPISALLTFLAGLPLGTEGPCVQMGTAVGDGVIKCLGREKHKGWRRYIMTGGAAAGFSIATSSPISAIIFSMEEIHKHYSPMLLSAVSVSVLVAQLTSRLLAAIGIGDIHFFHMPNIESMPLSAFFVPLIIGIVCGLCSVIYTRFYLTINRIIRRILEKLSVKIVLPILFALIAIVGFFLADALGTGHSIIESLFTPGYIWYMLILLLLIRAIGTIVCNVSGATGGVFLPNLAFGAIVGALCADGMISLGWIGSEHYVIIVVLGITSFLGATSRIPLTACVFAVEALNGINNIIPIVIATTISLVIVEAFGIEDLTDTIIEAQQHKITDGKKSFDIEAPLVVKKNSFVVGKHLSDILWPNSCVVVAFNSQDRSKNHGLISDGDIITVHYTTYDPNSTANELCNLVGEQSEDLMQILSSYD